MDSPAASGRLLPFRAAIARARAQDRTALLAEVKVKGSDGTDLLRGRSPAELAQAYTKAGADCVSVVTGKWFGGTFELLGQVRAAVPVPVLCKDFIRSPRDVARCNEAGADAVLVTLAVLPDLALRNVFQAAQELGLDAFVEVASEAELDRALAMGATLIAINNRDIRLKEREGEGIDRSLSLRRGDPEVTWVSASGIGTPEEAARLAGSGFDALLVGTQLLLAEDPGQAVEALVRAGQRRAG